MKEKVKLIPNSLSALRFLGAICLLFLSPASVAFWVIYCLSFIFQPGCESGLGRLS